jgi:O-antigen/teichoic acid export membrane protein
MGVGLVVIVWIARYLGPEQFGVLSYATAFVSLFSFLSGLGLDSLIVRELVNGRIDAASAMGTTFGLKAAGGLAVLLLSVSLAFITDRGQALTVTLIAVAAAGTLFQSTDVLDYYFQARAQTRYITIARGLAFQIVSVIKIALIILRAPLITFALAGLGETILGALLLWIVYRRNSPDPMSWRWDTKTALRLLSESWPLMFSALMVTLYMKIDQVMLKGLSSPEETGKYAAAVRVSEGWYFVPVAIATSSFPKMVDAGSISRATLDTVVRRLYGGMLTVCYLIVIPLCVLAGPLSSWLYGSKFAGMGGMLALNSWSGLFVGIGVVRYGYLIVSNQTRYYAATILTGAVLNIALNVIFMPRYGGMAAAAATLAAQAIACYLSCFFFGPLRAHGWLISRILPPWAAWREARLSEIVRLERLPQPLRRLISTV